MIEMGIVYAIAASIITCLVVAIDEWRRNK